MKRALALLSLLLAGPALGQSRFIGTYALDGSDSGTPPAGSSGAVQFNLNGAFSSDSGLTYDAATGTLTLAAAGKLNFSTDAGLARSGAGVVKVTNGSTGAGSILVADGAAGALAYGFAASASEGIYRGASGQLYLGAGGGFAYFYGDGSFNIPYDVGAYTLGTSRDVWVTRGPAAATLQLGKAPNATPVANTLIVGESGSGLNIAGGNGTITSGAGTGSGAGSTLIFQTPTPGGSGSGAQTQTTRMTISDQGVTMPDALLVGGAYPYNYTTDAYPLGYSGGLWQTFYLSRATLGSKSKALTDATATAFATFTIADGADYAGEVIYKVVAKKGTGIQTLAGRARFAATREGSTYTVSVSQVGTETVAAATGTLIPTVSATGGISIAGTGGVVTLSADYDTSFASPDSLTIYYRFDSPDAALAITPL